MGHILDLLKDIHVSNALKKRLLEIEEDYKRLEQENRELQAENGALKQKQLSTEKNFTKLNKAEKEYTKYRGVLFRKKSGVGYNETAYCPHCQSPLEPMWSMGRAKPFECLGCGFQADFTKADLASIMEALKKI